MPITKTKATALKGIAVSKTIKNNPINGYGRCTLCHCNGYRSRPQKDDVCDTCGHNYYKHKV